jgi:hypothetical protein
MIVNLVAVGVYWAKDLRLYAGLYLVFFGMAIAGHRAWRKSMEQVGDRDAAAKTGDGQERPQLP